MATLTTSITPLDVLVRKEFLYDGEKGHGEYEPAYAFAATSIKNWAMTFTVMTHRGAQFTRLPLHALVWKEDAPDVPLDWLQLWDCFDYEFTYVQYSLLKEMRCRVFMKDGGLEHGEYIGTFDWYHGDNDNPDTSFSQVPEGHKTGHLVRLDNGLFAIQPNNRIYWSNADFVINPYRDDERPDFLINTRKWSVESMGPRWVTEDSDAYFYAYKKKEDTYKEGDSNKSMGRTAAKVRSHGGLKNR